MPGRSNHLFHFYYREFCFVVVFIKFHKFFTTADDDTEQWTSLCLGWFYVRTGRNCNTKVGRWIWLWSAIIVGRTVSYKSVLLQLQQAEVAPVQWQRRRDNNEAKYLEDKTFFEMYKLCIFFAYQLFCAVTCPTFNFTFISFYTKLVTRLLVG